IEKPPQNFDRVRGGFSISTLVNPPCGRLFLYVSTITYSSCFFKKYVFLIVNYAANYFPASLLDIMSRSWNCPVEVSFQSAENVISFMILPPACDFILFP
ncbi:MAG: hypothetical protein OSJ44_12355, partial [Lachnospiraceae bacterium]|nr:hypothetical protein [Lachnospiraceae bacterium]